MAGVRSFFGFMMAFPGKKMSFMGSEFGQVSQWDYHGQLEWDLLENEGHRRMQTCIRELNHIYARNCPLWQDESNKGSFYWIDPGRTDPDVVAFSRIDEEGDELLVVCNFSDTACNYKLGLPEEKTYTVIFDSNLTRYGGTQTEENRRILAALTSMPNWNWLRTVCCTCGTMSSLTDRTIKSPLPAGRGLFCVLGKVMSWASVPVRRRCGVPVWAPGYRSGRDRAPAWHTPAR